MNRCPFCFDSLERQEAVFVCTDPAGRCPDEPDLRWQPFRGGPVPERRPATYVAPASGEKRWKRPQTWGCRVCGGATSAQACPRCHQVLPPGWRDTVTTCIALAGARTCGKSVYLAVVVKQLALLAQQLPGAALGYGDSATQRTYVAFYERPLYEARGLIAATPRGTAADAPQRVPLVFTLGTLHGRRHVLVLRDVAGEDLEDPSVTPGPFRFFRDADGIIFLVDPLKRDAVRLMLAGIVDDKAELGGEPLTVLDNLARLLRDGAPAGASRFRWPSCSPRSTRCASCAG